MLRLIFCMLLMAPVFTFAADEQAPSSPQPKIIYKKKTKIDFNDAIVEGQVANPEGVYIVTPPEKQFGSLLKLRPNFHRELIRDSLLLK